MDLLTVRPAERPAWQCCYAGGRCSHPRVKLSSGLVHLLCAHHYNQRVSRVPDQKQHAEGDWEYMPFSSNGDWKLTSQDIAQNMLLPDRAATLARPAIYSPMLPPTYTTARQLGR